MPSFDCKTNVPITVPPASYFECWGTRRLPSSIQFSVGPTSLISPNTTPCLNWPIVVQTGVLGRGLFGTNMCRPVWSAFSSSGFGIIFNYNQFATTNPIACSENVPNMTTTWSLGTTEAGVTYSMKQGYCSKNQITGIVEVAYSVIASNGLCSTPISIYFYG